MNIKDLPVEIELSYASLNADVLEQYNVEEAIKQYIQRKYGATVSDFRYYWYDVNTILVHDIKWAVEDFEEDNDFESDLDENVDNTKDNVYNIIEANNMKKENKLDESTIIEEDSFMNKFGQYVDKPLSSEEFHALMKKMRDFYE